MSHIYHQKISDTKTIFHLEKENFNFTNKIEMRDDGEWLLSRICPEPHILIVGGGIKTEAQKQAAFKAGADMVVMGTAFEAKDE